MAEFSFPANLYIYIYIVGFLIVTLANVSVSVIQPIIYAFSVTQLFYFQLNEISVSTVEGMGHNPNIAEFEARNADTTQTYTKDINQPNELTLEEVQVHLFRGYVTTAESGLPRSIVHANQEENLADSIITNLPIIDVCVRPHCMSTKVIPGIRISNVLDVKTYAWVEYGEAFVISFGVSLFSFSEKYQSQYANTQFVGIILQGTSTICESFTFQWYPECLRSMSRWINSR